MQKKSFNYRMNADLVKGVGFELLVGTFIKKVTENIGGKIQDKKELRKSKKDKTMTPSREKTMIPLRGEIDERIKRIPKKIYNQIIKALKVAIMNLTLLKKLI